MKWVCCKMKFYGIFREGGQVNQVLCAVLVNLPVLAYGASIGWMSPMTLLLQSEYSPKGVPLTDAEAFQIAMVVTLAREVCGAIPVLNFAGEIFTLTSKDSGLVLTANQQAMILGVVQVVGSILASSVVERCGRKPLLCVTSLVSGLSMCLLGSWFLLRAYAIQAPSWLQWLPLMTLCVCIFCDASGLQPISIILAGEIFSYKYRGIVMGVTMGVASMSDFLQLLFFKPLAKAVGIHVSFFFFGIVCLITAAYVALVIPETKARSLEDIYRDLRKNMSTGEKEATENKEEITRF